MNPTKVYIAACPNCDNRVTLQTLASSNKKGNKLKCEKCGMINQKNHSNTFLKDRCYYVGKGSVEKVVKSL